MYTKVLLYEVNKYLPTVFIHQPSEASIDDSDESSEDESDEHEDYCHTCGEEGNLICCDSCPLVFHKDCHQPPLRHIPR